jgi:hypothetical protein
LSAALLAVSFIAGPVAYDRHGTAGAWAVGVALGVCWATGTAALAIIRLTRAAGRATHGLLLSMLVRMAVPMIVGAALDQRGGPLAAAGVFGWIVVYYLVMLAVESLLSVRLFKQAKNISKAL